MRLTARFLFLPALAVACLLVAQVAQAQHRITYFQGADTATAEPGDANNGDGEVLVDAIPTISGITDFSGLGSDGSWFFNFDQATNTQLADPEFGEVDDLPSWLTVDKVSAANLGRTLSDGSTLDTSFGGQTSWSTITLPIAAGGATGASGAVMAPASAGDSANVFESMFISGLDPGLNVSFTLSIVVDNTNGDYPTDKRMKVRALTSGGAQEVNMRLNNLPVDGIPDVYSFVFEGWENTDELRLQVRNNQAEFSGIGASIAGIMFDDVSIVPEPTSAILLMLGGLGLTLAGRRRR